MKLPKKPKRPKKSQSLSVWQRYDDKMKAWQNKCKEIKEAPKKKEAIAKKYR